MNSLSSSKKCMERAARLALLICLLMSPFRADGQNGKPPCGISARPAQASAGIVIRNVTVIDGTGASPKPAQSLVLKNGYIAEVGAMAKIKTPRGAKVVDGMGQFVIPGLWDMHVHLNKAKAESLPLFVANGVTGIRDMGGNLDEVKAMRQAALDGKLIAPRIRLSGQMLESLRTKHERKQ